MVFTEKQLVCLNHANDYVWGCEREKTTCDPKIIKAFQRICNDNTLPEIVTILRQTFEATSPEFKDNGRFADTLKTIGNALELSEDNYFRVIVALMNVSIGRGACLTASFDNTFYGIHCKSGRKDIWGSEWELPVFITMALIEDIQNDVDIFNPSKEELLKSETIKVATTFSTPREKVEEFISSL